MCLPALDAGGYGAKAESWAFGTDFEGLQVWYLVGLPVLSAGLMKGAMSCEMQNCILAGQRWSWALVILPVTGPLSAGWQPWASILRLAW